MNKNDKLMKAIEEMSTQSDNETTIISGATLRDMGYIGAVDNLVYMVKDGEISILEVEDDN